MSKKKKQKWNDVKKSKAFQAVMDSLNKKGRIKGKNKRQTKTLKGMCTHHHLNKKGNIKRSIINDNNGRVYCEICGTEFSTQFVNNEDLKRITGEITELTNQLKYASVEIGANSKTIDYASQLGGLLIHFPKMYKRITSLVERQDSTSKKKKYNNGEDSESFGVWNMAGRRHH